ncbi:hypothetical protein CPT_MarsHill_212 [Staphylococcus phage MarsHill]|nr:hypothetical protein CPT_MarsHill_212 [Staphylococcus phage MarsHill]
MTLLENISTKPEINGYMEKVFNYHLAKIIENNYIDDIKESTIQVINKNLELMSDNKLNESSYRDIFNDPDTHTYEETKELFHNFNNKDNKFYKEINNQIDSKVDEIKNNKYKVILESFTGYNDFDYDQKYSINKSSIINLFDISYLGADRFRRRKSKNCKIKFDPSNLVTLIFNYSEIYSLSTSDVDKIKRDFYSLYKDRDYDDSLIKTFEDIIPLDSYTRNKALSLYGLNLEKIMYNLDSDSKNKLIEVNNVITSIIKYQMYAKDKNNRTDNMISKVKNNSIMRKLQLDYESSNTDKYEIELVPKHLKNLFS